MATQDVTTALASYLDELSFGLAATTVYGFDTAKYCNIHKGVNGTMRLNSLASTINFHAGSCDTTGSGSTTFAGNVLTTSPININLNLCLETLQGFWLGQYMSSSYYSAKDLGKFTDFVLAEVASKTQKEIEKLAWQGSTNPSSKPYAAYTGITGNMRFADGFFQAGYTASATTVNMALTAITTANAVNIVDLYYNNNATADMKASPDGLRIFLSPTDFDAYLVNLRTLNLYHGTLDFQNIKEISHLGARNLTVTLANGMDGLTSGAAIMSNPENMNIGTLETGDYTGNSFDGIWNPYSRIYQINPRFKLGFQFTFAERVARTYLGTNALY